MTRRSGQLPAGYRGLNRINKYTVRGMGCAARTRQPRPGYYGRVTVARRNLPVMSRRHAACHSCPWNHTAGYNGGLD